MIKLRVCAARRSGILATASHSVLSPEVDESTIQLPSLLLVVGAVSLPLKCEYFQLVSSSLLDRVLVKCSPELTKFAEMLLENNVAFITL